MTKPLSSVAIQKLPLWKAVVDNPQDWPHYLVLADYLEEQGQEDWARCLRWMGEHKKTPAFAQSSSIWWEWAWNDQKDKSHYLRWPIWFWFAGENFHYEKLYQTQYRAFKALMLALKAKAEAEATA